MIWADPCTVTPYLTMHQIKKVMVKMLILVKLNVY